MHYPPMLQRAAIPALVALLALPLLLRPEAASAESAARAAASASPDKAPDKAVPGARGASKAKGFTSPKAPFKAKAAPEKKAPPKSKSEKTKGQAGDASKGKAGESQSDAKTEVKGDARGESADAKSEGGNSPSLLDFGAPEPASGAPDVSELNNAIEVPQPQSPYQ